MNKIILDKFQDIKCTNLELIANKFNLVKGEFVLDSFSVKRIIGLAQDDFDYLYVLYDGYNFKLSSCLCPIFKLKNKIDQKDYDELIRLANLNHKDILFNLNLKEEFLNNYKNTNIELLTDIYQNIN